MYASKHLFYSNGYYYFTGPETWDKKNKNKYVQFFKIIILICDSASPIRN